MSRSSFIHRRGPAYLSQDTFNRANSTSNPGATDGIGSLDPLTWTTLLGTCGIDTNQAYASANGAGGYAIATVDLVTADIDIVLTTTNIGSLGCALLFRCSDASNYWIWVSIVSTTYLFKFIAGSGTQIGSPHTGATGGNVLRVVAKGSLLNCYRDDVLLETQTDSYNSTATKHGLWFQGINGRLDRWQAYSS